jgi:MFS family permease
VFTRDFGTPDGDGRYDISPENLAVMTSMINMGELVGSLLAAPLNDLFGRKGALLTGSIIVVVGVVLQLSTTSSRALITAGRAVSGFGVGTFSVTSPLYMGVCLCLCLNLGYM